FDAAVCFGLAEPIEDHRPLLTHVKRLLKHDGLFIMSLSVDETIKETAFERLNQFLTAHFKHVELLGQAIYAGSSIWPMRFNGDDNVRETVIARDSADDFAAIGSEMRVPSSLVAVAGDSPPTIHSGGSILLDERNELLKDKDKSIQELLESKAYQEKALDWC